MSVRTPSYRLHKPTGQAVVTLSGRDLYLGKHDTAESRAEYDRLLAEWLAAGRQIVPRTRGVDRRSPAVDGGFVDLAVNELVLAYLKFADGYYRKNDRPTKEPVNIRLAVRPLLNLYGHTSARWR